MQAKILVPLKSEGKTYKGKEIDLKWSKYCSVHTEPLTQTANVWTHGTKHNICS